MADDYRKGKVIKKIRKFLGMNQQEFASSLNVKKRSTISNWENDKAEPTLSLRQWEKLDSMLEERGKRMSDFE